MERIELKMGKVREKRILTPNDFVSHMVEHIAWRVGFGIDLEWDSEDWERLGKRLGEEIKKIASVEPKDTAALGSIDDGTAKVKISFGEPFVEIKSTDNVDLDLLRKSRCEQLENSIPLEELLKGLSESLNVGIEIVVMNFKDQHHTWEGVFRTIGICLQKALVPIRETTDFESNKVEKDVSKGEISVLERSLLTAEVKRGTAETSVRVRIDMSGDPSESRCNIEAGESIMDCVRNADKLFKILSSSFGVRIDIDFKAKMLSSSHVVFEDIGLVMGRALLEILKLRFNETGAMGAGSSITSPADFDQNAAVCISVEGRKFWDLIPSDGDEKRLLRELIIGQDVFGSLRSEDLDDFIDGLSGGMTASIIIHINDASDPDRTWQEVFANLGTALREVFMANPYRKGVPPGVKATLS